MLGGIITGLIASILLTLYFYNLKPKIKLPCCIDISEYNILKIKIENENHLRKWYYCFFRKKSIINLKIEVAIFKIENRKTTTIHLEIVKDEFLFIPSQNKFIDADDWHYRIFKTSNEDSDKIENKLAEDFPNRKLRLRVFGQDENSMVGTIVEGIYLFNERNSKCLTLTTKKNN
ncbi:MAG: hypothetical protein EAZ53_05825 [Bacteroidetes bacterium]|nr:MAG: hypothetical protein EAZ53_05825 [Bacteroidota bacterium]